MVSTASKIVDALTDRDLTATLEEVPVLGEICRVPGDTLPRSVRICRGLGYDFLIDQFGVDTGEAIDVVYNLRSTITGDEVIIKGALNYGGTLVSVWDAYPATLTTERELAEMFGLLLAGHPNPKRLLTTEEIEPPLLKSTRIRTVEEARDR